MVNDVSHHESRLSYLNARYYNATLARFVSEDTLFLALGNNNQVKEITEKSQQEILADPQILNSYSYANNNPIVNSDPTGQLSTMPPQVQALQKAIIGMQQWLGNYISQSRQNFNLSEFQSKSNEAMKNGNIYLGTTDRGKNLQFGVFGVIGPMEGASNFAAKYGGELGLKMNQVAETFQKENIFASEHAILKTVTREIRGITPEKVIDVFKNGPQYLDREYTDTFSHFKDGIRIAVDKITQEIKTVVTQNSMDNPRFTKIK